MESEATTQSQDADLAVENIESDELIVDSISQLRTFVNQNLCRQNQLEPDIFPTTERLLFQSGKPCGILFVVHGPRSIQLNAIWESIKNTVIFYGSTGEKIDKVTLEEVIDLDGYEAP